MLRLCFAAAALLTLSAWVRAGSDSRRTAVVEAVEKVQRCVVSITSEKLASSNSRWPFSPDRKSLGFGQRNGERRTRRRPRLRRDQPPCRGQSSRNHRRTIRWNAGIPAHVLQTDPVMDLALLKVDADHTLAAVAIGTSSDLMVGETVITIGNAFGYENTVSVGIISALHRDVTLSDEQVYRNLIQTDACINPGNSGGPLVNVNGELIGINVAVRAGAQGIGFALPIDEVKRVATAMLSTRRLASSWHGLVSSEQRRGPKRGVVVSEVEQGSPAESSGFKPGDELVRIGDLAIASPLDVERAMLDVHPGHPATVMIRRGKSEKAIPLDVKSVSAPASSPDDLVWRLLGLKTQPVSTDFVSSVSPKLRGGLYIQAVSPGSPAAQAAIHKGDILVGMNVGARHWETIRPDNILYVLRQPETTQTQSAILYLVRRNGIQPCRISLADTTVQSMMSQ